ncbi:hypothetical protein AMR41_08375 [Hapalosiphon sp. MRB220]|nr:hypothetical protein AMR41_08375 [Hapalosiphon sp. MRB220]
MPLDFCGQNLGGRSFKGQNLEGANFSCADIRGANFTGANLRGAKFTGAKAGLQRRWAIGLLLVSWLLAGVAGFFSLFTAAIPVFFFESPDYTNTEKIILGVIVLIQYTVFFIVTVRKGLIVGLGAVAVAIVVAIAFAVTVAGAIAGAFAFAIAIAFAFDVAVAVAGVFAVVVAVAVARAFAVAVAGAIAGALALSLFSAYIGWRAWNGDEKDAWIRLFAIVFAAFGGTNFRNANLTDVDFANATLKSTDFRGTILIRTRFHQAKMLSFVRPGKSYFQNAEVRQLLVTGQGRQDKKFERQDLQGVNLQGANLTDASFIGSNLSEANLQDADLSRAKLKQTQLDGTDFTGVYIEDWGITSDTKFDSVRCEYVYMRLPTKENPNPLRKPDNLQEVFADGEFGDFIKPIVDTLDLYHNQGVDPRAIAIAFKQLAENNPDAELEIVAMEKRGQDKFLLRAKTAETADKSELSAEYFDTYNEIKALTAREIKLLVAEKENQIRRLENMVMTALERPSFYSENRTINMGDGNYNEDIQGDYIKGDYSEYG